VNVEQLAAQAANLFYIRNGKVTRLLAYWDRAHALSDLGLPSEGNSP